MGFCGAGLGGGRRGRTVRPNSGFNREGPRGDRADPMGERGIEKIGLREAGGQESFESFKVKGFCKDSLTVERDNLKEKDFKGMKDKGFKGFGEKDLEENCFGVKKRSSKEEGFRSLKEEGFVLSFENEMKCGVCGVEEELHGATVFPGGVASKAPPGRVEGLGDKRELVRLGDPRRPSEQEVEDHCLSGHLPYRNWCYHCVRGRGRDSDHRKGIEEERGLSEFSFDYCFPGDEFGLKLTILAGARGPQG